MTRFLFPLLAIISIQALASPLNWSGGNTLAHFTSDPYQRREPVLTFDEQQVLITVREMLNGGDLKPAAAELKLQIARKPSAVLLFALAQVQQHQGQPDDAIESLRLALELIPEFIRAHESLGLLYTQKGSFQEARPHLRMAAAYGTQPRVFALLGYGYLQQGQPSAAKAAFSQAILLSDEDPQWIRGLLHAALAEGDTSLAASLTEQLLKMSPEDAQLHLIRASLAQQKEQWTKAIASLETAYLFEPDDDKRWQLAQLYLSQGLFHSAQPLLATVLKRPLAGKQQEVVDAVAYLVNQEQSTLAQPLLEALVAHAELTDSQKSRCLTLSASLEGGGIATVLQKRTLLNEALMLNPVNGEALLALAELEEQGAPARAESLYQRAAALSKYRLEALQRHAQLLLNQNAYPRAQRLLQAAVKTAPNDDRVRNNLALVTRVVQSQQQ